VVVSKDFDNLINVLDTLLQDEDEIRLLFPVLHPIVLVESVWLDHGLDDLWWLNDRFLLQDLVESVRKREKSVCFSETLFEHFKQRVECQVSDLRRWATLILANAPQDRNTVLAPLRMTLLLNLLFNTYQKLVLLFLEISIKAKAIGILWPFLNPLLLPLVVLLLERTESVLLQKQDILLIDSALLPDLLEQCVHYWEVQTGHHLLDQIVHCANHFFMFPILASPDQLDGGLIDDPSRLLANEAQNRLCTLHYLDVSALPKNNI
jgi:hypothetical protein